MVGGRLYQRMAIPIGYPANHLNHSIAFIRQSLHLYPASHVGTASLGAENDKIRYNDGHSQLLCHASDLGSSNGLCMMFSIFVSSAKSINITRVLVENHVKDSPE